MRRIDSYEGICSGAPRIDGTRLTCANVAWNLSGMSLDEFFTHWPYLTAEDIRNCLEYCARRQCVIDEVPNFCESCSLDTRPDDELEDEEPDDVWKISAALRLQHFSDA